MMDLLELGRSVATDPTCHDMQIGDPPRPLTNVEMHAASMWLKGQVQQLVDRDGCCGGEISQSGRCPKTGYMCPLYQAARKIERQVFHTRETT